MTGSISEESGASSRILMLRLSFCLKFSQACFSKSQIPDSSSIKIEVFSGMLANKAYLLKYDMILVFLSGILLLVQHPRHLPGRGDRDLENNKFL
jgi:hypothetical protein